MDTFIQEISSKIVVIGSVARGVRWPKDLDFLWDLDNEQAKKVINAGIQKHKLVFESQFIGSWTFRNYGWMVEIISIHYGPDYRQIRRRATRQQICGLNLLVAQCTDTPKVVKKYGEWVNYSK